MGDVYMTEQELVGAWSLVRFLVEFSDGRSPIYPYGEEAGGMLLYTPQGRMSATLSRGDRKPFAAGGLEAAAAAAPEEKCAAFDSYLAYAGRYRIEGDEVIHTLDFSLMPNAVGTEQRRKITWDGEILRLSYELPTRSGNLRQYNMLWKRFS
jgi:hypothetical protein